MQIHKPLLLALSAALALPALAVNPPDRVHYQGVLRDAADNPRNGSFDMTFRFFDAPSGGNEILVDRHQAGGSGAVAVSNGLFGVELGGGVVSDGAAPLPGDPYTTLAKAFRDFAGVWMQVEIGVEALSPRIHVTAAPYALHAQSAESAVLLGGQPAGSYLDTSVSSQTKAGNLTANLVTANNGLLFSVPGARVQPFADLLDVVAGDADGDDLRLVAGNDITDGSIWILGDGAMTLRAGDGNFVLLNGATETVTATVDPTGTITAANDLVASGNELRFGAAGARLTASASDLVLMAGNANTDNLVLSAGNDFTDGAIEILGDSFFRLYSGNGQFTFVSGTDATTRASLDTTGTFSVANDLVASGNELRFGTPGARLTANTGFLTLAAGSSGTDDLFLRASDNPLDGSIEIFGRAGMFLRSGAGAFTFIDGQTAGTMATIAVGGTITATQDLVASGNDVHLGPAPTHTRMTRDASFDDLYFARDEDNNNTDARFAVFTNVGIEQMRIFDGDEAAAFFDGAVTANGLDYAEAFWIADPSLEAGEVTVFDPARPGFVARAAEAYAPNLAGVISGKPGFLTGGSFDAEEAADPDLAQQMHAAFAGGDAVTARAISSELARKKAERQRSVALAGRVPVKVDGSYGAIRAGDHLTSSKTPGHAMVMKDAGPSIGVALEDRSGPGTGVVLVFVQPGHYVPPALLADTAVAQGQLERDIQARTPDPATGVQVLPTSLQLVLDGAGDREARFSIFRDGAGDRPQAEVFRVDERGDVWAQGAFRPRSMDLAEMFELAEPVEAGEVVVVDRARPGKLARARQAEDGAVVGVVAADPGVLLGSDVSRLLTQDPALAEALSQARASKDVIAEEAIWQALQERFLAGRAPVALSGTVSVKADAAYGAIEPEDLLVSSPTPGHAMRAQEPPSGAVFGKALEPLAGGAGTIRMLVWQR